MSNKRLPTVTSDIPRDLRNFIDRLREILGSSGDERFVTAKELTSTGVVGTSGTGALINPANVVQVSTPANPGVLTVSAAIQNILIEWAAPRYSGHAYAEVWSNGTNNLGTAVKVGVAPGNSYVDSVGPSVSRYYWVRFINVANVEGPFNSVNGTLGETGPAVEFMLETLTAAALDPASPYSKFAVRADLFYVAPDLDFNQEATPTATAVGQLWYKPSTEVTTTWTGSAWGTFNTTLPFIVNSSPQTINGVSVPAGVYMDAAFIKNGTITNAKIGNATIDDAKIASLSAAKITSGFIDAARLDASVINAKVTNIDAAVIGSGTINSARIGSLSANSITSGTLSADRIGAGSASVGSGYTFILGSGQTINGYPAAVGGSNTNSAGMGISGYITNSSSNGWGATTGATVAPNGLGGAFYNSLNSSFNTFRCFGGLAQGSWGGSFIYHRSWGTTNNGTLPPYSIAYGGAGDSGIYAAHWGETAPGRNTEAFLANQTTGFAAVFRKYTGGTTLVTEANICTGNYSFYSTAGAVYATAGFLPFTGSHDGLIYRTDVYAPGDIVIDAEVLAKLDISNSVVRFEKSSAANQKGVVGVFVQAFDETPSDWNPALDMPDPNNGVYGDVVGDPIVNSAAYEVPADMQVAHVNALGEGLINVCGEGGTIEKGDLIVTSSTPGKGMKQADDLVRNITVAKARETVTFSSPTEVKQVACIYMCG